jgi:hypothetical protein
MRWISKHTVSVRYFYNMHQIQRTQIANPQNEIRQASAFPYSSAPALVLLPSLILLALPLPASET